MIMMMVMMMLVMMMMTMIIVTMMSLILFSITAFISAIYPSIHPLFSTVTGISRGKKTGICYTKGTSRSMFCSLLVFSIDMIVVVVIVTMVMTVLLM